MQCEVHLVNTIYEAYTHKVVRRLVAERKIKVIDGTQSHKYSHFTVPRVQHTWTATILPLLTSATATATVVITSAAFIPTPSASTIINNCYSI